MRSLNKVTLIGNLGKEPEYKLLEGKMHLAKFALATSETFKDKAGIMQTVTEWHNIIFWGALAEAANKYLHKGSLVYMEGKIKTRTYDDKDGNKKYVVEIIGDELIMLDKKTGSEIIPIATGTEKEKEPKPGKKKDDDLPF